VAVTAVCLLMVNQHPEPVDDCPCFEDAIAFMSVVLGVLLSTWAGARFPMLDTARFTIIQPGSSFDSPTAIATWTAVALLKLVFGILGILAWRLVAKPTAQTVLPPLFRFVAHAVPFQLPHRRHYTPATEYANHPPHSLRSIPSMIDLSLDVTAEGDVSAVASALGTRAGSAVKRRGAGMGALEKMAEVRFAQEDQREDVKHYDADGASNYLAHSAHGTDGGGSANEGLRLRRHWRHHGARRTRHIRGARLGRAYHPAAALIECAARRYHLSYEPLMASTYDPRYRLPSIMVLGCLL
jgi:hypothetical protein